MSNQVEKVYHIVNLSIVVYTFVLPVFVPFFFRRAAATVNFHMRSW